MLGEAAANDRQHLVINEARDRVANQPLLVLQLVFDARYVERIVCHDLTDHVVVAQLCDVVRG